MKFRTIIIIILIGQSCFSQQLTKKGFKNIIKESRKEIRKLGNAYYSKIISNNKDSIFFNSKKVKIYTSIEIAKEKEYCRTVELRFVNAKKAIFIDCQNCTEPSSCYVYTDKNIYKYRIKEIDNELYIFFTNKYNEINFKIASFKKDKLSWRKYYEIEFHRVKQIHYR